MMQSAYIKALRSIQSDLNVLSLQATETHYMLGAVIREAADSTLPKNDAYATNLVQETSDALTRLTSTLYSLSNKCERLGVIQQWLETD